MLVTTFYDGAKLLMWLQILLIIFYPKIVHISELYFIVCFKNIYLKYQGIKRKHIIIYASAEILHKAVN